MEVIKEVPLEVEITEEQVTEERQEEALAIKEDNLDQLLNPKTELCLLAIQGSQLQKKMLAKFFAERDLIQ